MEYYQLVKSSFPIHFNQILFLVKISLFFSVDVSEHFVCLSSVCSSVCLSVCPFVCLSVCLSVRLKFQICAYVCAWLSVYYDIDTSKYSRNYLVVVNLEYFVHMPEKNWPHSVIRSGRWWYSYEGRDGSGKSKFRQQICDVAAATSQISYLSRAWAENLQAKRRISVKPGGGEIYRINWKLKYH